MTSSEIRLECLKLVWPTVGNPDPSVYLAKAETLLKWVLSGGDNGSATPVTQPTPESPSPDTPARAPASRRPQRADR